MAHEEIGQTCITTAQARLLAAVFLAAIAVVAPLQAVVDLRHPERELSFALTLFTEAATIAEAFRLATAPDELPPAERSGWRPAGFGERVLAANAQALRVIQTYEHRQKDEQHSFLTRALITPVQAFLTGALGAGNERAYPGRDGWAFFRDAVDHLTMPGFLEPRQLERRAHGGSEWQAPPLPDPRPAILYFHEYLRQRGITLMVLPVPVKAAIYPDQLSARYAGLRDWLENPDLGKLFQTLDRAGVDVYPSAEALYLARLSGLFPVFLKTDTHWTPEAVDRVARDLATRIRNLNVLPAADPTAYQRGEATHTNLGDIAAALLRLEGAGVFEDETVTVQPVVSPDGRPWESDPDSPVLLLGDSFANIYSAERMAWGSHAGLAEQLSYHLQRPVDRIVINDAGAYATRQALAEDLRRGDRLAGKKVVIWEFAARELSTGDWRHIDWGRIDIGSAQRADSTQPGGVEVTGVVSQITRPPRPGAVTYRDCITEIHLTDIQGDLPHTQAVVYVLGMQDNQWTPAAELPRGQRVRLRLTDWETAQQEAGRATMRHEPLDDPHLELILLPEYWGEVAVSDRGAVGP